MYKSILFHIGLCLGWVLLFLPTAFTQELPRGLTAEERQQLPDYLHKSKAKTRQVATPPASPRAPAEWEEMQGVSITWTPFFSEILAQIVDHAQEVVTVYIHTEPAELAGARAYLTSQGIDLAHNVEFIEGPNNSIWIRDYGANAVYVDGVDSLVFIDWIYNRPRPQDDALPALTGAHLGIPVIDLTAAPTDLVHTGGNFMADGQQRGFSSRLVLEENGPDNIYGTTNHGEPGVDSLMKHFMGIESYLLMTPLPFDRINHIDMHMKIVDEQTIIVGDYPDGIADGPQIEANIMYLIDEMQSAYGRPYRVVRMPMPPDEQGNYPDAFGDYRTYTNAVMLNSTVLLPTYDEQYDTTAIRIWQETLPGHDIIGIDCNDIIPLSGALHCITKEIGAADPIQMLHTPPTELVEGLVFDASVTVNHKHTIDEVTMYYSQDGMNYDSVDMIQAEGQWMAATSTLEPGELIYYFSARSSIGKRIEKPLTGRRGGGYRVEVQPVVSTQQWSASAVNIGSAFPNPASSIVMVPIAMDREQAVSATLYDIAGRRIRQVYQGGYAPHRQGIYIDAANLEDGVYILSIDIEGRPRAQQKIIVHGAR